MGSLCTSESRTREQVVNSKGALECERRRVSIQQQQQQRPEGDQDFSSLEDSEPRGSNASGCGTTSDDDLSPTTTTSPSDHQQRPMKSPESPPSAPQTAPPVNGSSDEDFGSRRIRKLQQQPHLTQRNNSTDIEGRGGGSGEGSGGSSGSEGEGGGGTGGSGSGSGSNGVTRSGSGGDSGSGGRGERVGSRRTSPTTESNSNSAELLHPNHVQLFGDESLKMLHRLGIAQSNADLDSTGSDNPSGGSTGSGHLVQGGHASSPASSPPLESSEESLIAIKPARPYADGPRGGHNLKGGAPSAIRSLVSDPSRSRAGEEQRKQQRAMVPEKIVLPAPSAHHPVAVVRDNDKRASSAVQRRVTNWQDDVE